MSENQNDIVLENLKELEEEIALEQANLNAYYDELDELNTEQGSDDMDDDSDKYVENNGNLPPGVDQRDLDDIGFVRR